MQRVPAERLRQIGEAIFIAAGTSEDEAGLVMRHLVNASLADTIPTA
jgi:LDH2 family malate/lactate/ureidoglycolate dehydrogenase